MTKFINDLNVDNFSAFGIHARAHVPGAGICYVFQGSQSPGMLILLQSYLNFTDVH